MQHECNMSYEQFSSQLFPLIGTSTPSSQSKSALSEAAAERTGVRNFLLVQKYLTIWWESPPLFFLLNNLAI